ncbi:hhaIM [Symbiodinium sp. CCMP2592]|nr:hhaIM [Symbiodinium sp. CCMP2592]
MGAAFWTRPSEVSQGLNYDLHMKVLNTQDFGIPQSRRRLYMVAIREDQKVKAFKWPEKRQLSVNALKQFLDRATSGEEILDLSKHTRAKGMSEADLWEKACVLDVGSSTKFQCGRTGVTPYLTKIRLSFQ